MRNPVVSIKRKFDGTPKKEWPGDLVDGSGEWLTVYYEAPPHETEAGAPVAHALGYFGVDRPLVVLVSFDAKGILLEYQCDAALPARLDGRTITWVDLDLDVMAAPALAPRVRDFDDFARNSREMGYDAAAIAAAGEGVNLALSLMLARACPFDASPAALLGRVMASRGPL
ncbi:MAG: DUF402 domain-containing protein [Dehalococcoidia bacterium]|nr:DUF402 domain-containing protein [Dehalococcoidia bacterium]